MGCVRWKPLPLPIKWRGAKTGKKGFVDAFVR